LGLSIISWQGQESYSHACGPVRLQAVVLKAKCHKQCDGFLVQAFTVDPQVFMSLPSSCHIMLNPKDNAHARVEAQTLKGK